MQTDNLYGIDYLYPRILILELIEKTKGCAVVWDQITPTVYQTHWSVSDRYYDVTITYLRNTYRVDFIRNGRSVLNVDAGNVPEVIDLFRVIGIYLGQDYVPGISAAIQNQLDCTHRHREAARGGVEVSGVARISSRTSFSGGGGVVLSGSSTVSKFLPGSGGMTSGGVAVVQVTYNIESSGGVVLAEPFVSDYQIIDSEDNGQYGWYGGTLGEDYVMFGRGASVV